MNILVLYHSKTGHTAAMAQLVGEGAQSGDGAEVRVASIDNAGTDDLLWADGVALGCPTQLGTVSWQMKQWWDEKAVDVWPGIQGRFGCAFSSSGGWGGGAEIACQSLLTILINFGYLVFGVTDYVADKHTLHYGTIQAGEPREEKEKEACRRLGKRLAQWCSQGVPGRTLDVSEPMPWD